MTDSVNQGEKYRVPDSYAREYLSQNESLTLEPTTVRTYDSHLTDFVSFLHQQQTEVLSADVDDVREYIESCVKQGNRKSTILGKLTTVKELYRYLRLRTNAANKLSLDPIELRQINVEDYNTPEKIERDALSREEIRKLFDSFDSYRNRLMAIVGVETGIRNSDIRNLRLEDLQEETIHVRNPKNSKSYDVAISEELRFELDYWLKYHRGGYGAANQSDFVFPSQHGEKLQSNGSLNRIIKEAAEAAGIQETIGRSQITRRQREALNTKKDHRTFQRVTTHTLRHSYITLLSESGVNLRIRQLAANHERPETTLRYDHSGEDVFESIRDRYDPPR